MQLIIFVVTFVTMLALTQFIGRSRMGRACRACSEDIKMANLLGIDTHVVISITFVLGAALAAVAGVLLGHVRRCHQPLSRLHGGLEGLHRRGIGGIGSIPGAVLGGLLLGVVEALTAGYLSTEYKDVMAFALLIFVLLFFMPTGILGRPEVEKDEKPIYACPRAAVHDHHWHSLAVRKWRKSDETSIYPCLHRQPGAGALLLAARLQAGDPWLPPACWW
ncbi:ABC transporter permease subunit [Escherichia coli]